MLNYRPILAVVIVLGVIFFSACGGGGSGSSGGSGGAVNVTISPTSASVGINGQQTFSASVTGNANTAVTWSASAGSITPGVNNTALFTAPNVAGGVTVTATSVADPTKFASANVGVGIGLATVTGRIISGSSGNGIAGVRVELRNQAGNVLVTATTNATGHFSVGVSTDAKRFQLQPASIPLAFYKAYVYNSESYSATITTCSAPLPTLTANATAPLLGNVQVPTTGGPPPPPPSGCP